MQLGNHPDLKMLQLQGKWSSLPYDSVNQLEMMAISLQLTYARHIRIWQYRNSLPKSVGILQSNTKWQSWLDSEDCFHIR